MYTALDALLRFVAITSVIWLPCALLSIVSTKLVSLLGRRKTIALGVIGVPAHELSHAIVALLCNHKIVGMSLFTFKPSMDGTLGYVNHQYRKSWLSPFALLAIGLAPIFGGILGLYALTFALRPDVLQIFIGYELTVTDLESAITVFGFIGNTVIAGDFWITLIWLLGAFSIVLFSVPSPADFQSCRPAVFSMLALFISCAVFFAEQFELFAYSIGNLLILFAWPIWAVLVAVVIIYSFTFAVSKVRREISSPKLG